MLLFRSEEHVDRWSDTWGIPKGALLTLEQGWELARRWYGDRLDPARRRRTLEDVEALFAELGLTGPFWRLRP